MSIKALLFISLASYSFGQEPRSAPLIDANTANLPSQKIGRNDLVAISVYNSPEFTRTIRVDGEGQIRLPLLDQPIRAEGLLPRELEKEVARALKAEKLLVDPLVTVTVAEYKSRPISVMGAVRKPVTFQAAGPLTLLEALARAEGLTADAGSEVFISKADQPDGLVRRIAIRTLLDGSDPSANVRLSGGEDIRVMQAGKVFVVGNVRKPGAYRIGEESSTTVLKAVAMAEGLIPYSAKRAVIYRREAVGSVNELQVELSKIMDQKQADIAILPNDVLYIPDAKGRRAGWAAVERLLLFGSGASTALIYGAAVR